MDNLLRAALAEGLSKHFTTINNYGYTPIINDYKLILALYIEEVLSGNFEIELIQEDYTILKAVMECLLGSSCVLPYPYYKSDREGSLVTKTSTVRRLKTTEHNQLRLTEESAFRNIERGNL